MADVFIESCGAVFSGKSPANHIEHYITVSQCFLMMMMSFCGSLNAQTCNNKIFHVINLVFITMIK